MSEHTHDDHENDDHENAADAGIPGQPVPRALRATFLAALDEARRRNAPLVEAEHLLLALTLDPSTPVRPALRGAGLDHDRVEAALRAEREASLRAAGVEPVPEERLAAAPRVTRPRVGASAKEVLVRAHRATVARRRGTATEPADLLAAIAGLELGTVPRALELAGVDRAALAAAVSAA